MRQGTRKGKSPHGQCNGLCLGSADDNRYATLAAYLAKHQYVCRLFGMVIRQSKGLKLYHEITGLEGSKSKGRVSYKYRKISPYFLHHLHPLQRKSLRRTIPNPT